ncbi:hypothetical protein BKA70DRAFT_1332535 [Coprinopsis sp. MPI-PUGE-AT-0042]|nr:hypothetical protein BKA70DRAFT_1332535 [Coprinopsis sp. MPI-PUGE-AT-0042]
MTMDWNRALWLASRNFLQVRAAAASVPSSWTFSTISIIVSFARFSMSLPKGCQQLHVLSCVPVAVRHPLLNDA